MIWTLAVALAQPCGEAPTDPRRDWVGFAGGTFAMGTPPGAPEIPASPPARPVTVGPFELARSEVTVAEYERCVALGSCTAYGTGDGCGGEPDHPVNCVSYRQAETYCRFVDARLPTEAEWEFAARGVESRWFTWGNTWDDRAFSASRRSVGSCPFTDTPQGVHDLAGSGREWTSTSSASGSHVSKGMMCGLDIACAAYNRFPGQSDDEQLDYLGFRCARAPSSSLSPHAALDITASLPASRHPPQPPTVHWSMLLDELPVVKQPGVASGLCQVTVTFGPDGAATEATPDATCATKVATAATEAALALKVAGREHGATTVVPVRVEPR